MVAKPSGTWIPLAARCRIISPSEAFLPPTLLTSERVSSDNHTTRSAMAHIQSVRILIGSGEGVRMNMLPDAHRGL